MKKLILIILVIYSVISQAQETKVASVENRIYGVQASLGLWSYGEFKLDNTITLRTEVGMYGGYVAYKMMGFYDEKGFIFIPEISISSRWYYNLHRRHLKGKNIISNSGNFWSLRLGYVPNLLISNNSNFTKNESSIDLIPMWGMRRAMGKHFDFELGLGVGYAYRFVIKPKFEGKHTPSIYILLRFGYHS